MKRFFLSLLYLSCTKALLAQESLPPGFFRSEPLPLEHPNADAKPPEPETSISKPREQVRAPPAMPMSGTSPNQDVIPTASPKQTAIPVTVPSTESTVAARVEYLQKLILSVRSLPKNEKQRLQTESESLFLGVCKSSDPIMALSCSLEAVGGICRVSPNPAACLSMMDALIVERLNSNRFISARERYEMMSRGDDHKERLAEALNHRYGSLAAVFSMNQAAECKPSDFNCLAQGIEIYCQAEAQKGRFSYQNCAALIGLFIGNNE